MKNKKTYYQKLDIIRILSCIAVFLYHLNILKGGFLAVCIFFTLSGYLSCISLLQKEKFKLKDYYISRVKKLYIPLFITVMITIATLTLFPEINWLNLKPETTSVLLGYNNFWQLNANLDYFARHIASPFMHMWYISILLQFELIFPIVFIILKKIGEKTKKYIPAILTYTLAVASYSIFYYAMLDNNIMYAYYNTLARIYSCLLGVSLAFISYYHKPILSNKLQEMKLNNLIFYTYLILLAALTFTLTSTSKYLSVFMLLTSLITIRLIDYGTLKENNNIITKLIKGLSSISYEIYLIQYPVIFIFQNLKLDTNIKIPSILLITIILSYILHLSLNIKKDNKIKVLRILLCIPILCISIYGTYQYIITKDHTKEMQELEAKIQKNKLLTEKKQQEYQEKLKEEQDAWQLELNEFTNKEEELKQKITNLPVVGVGDSVMLGAANALYQTFPNGYFDGKVNRTTWEAQDIITDLKNRGLLGNIIIFNLGTNGECSNTCKKQLMQSIGDREVFWVNATNPDYDTFNPNLKKMAKEYSNIHIVDWVSVAEKHPEYLASDRVHVGGLGAKVYSQTIYETIYNYYLQELNKQKEEKIKEHEQLEKNKITFIGNDLLLNTFEYLQTNYSSSEFIINSNLSYTTLKQELEQRIGENTLTNNLVFIFDNTLILTKEEYQDIVRVCKDRNINIITTKNIPLKEQDNLHIIDLTEELKKHENYLSPDRIHLSKEGNIYLVDLINDLI